MKRAAIYARVSTVDRGQDPETQLRQLREYADRRAFAVVREYVDHASGARSDRAEYRAMLEAARRREFDVLLVWPEFAVVRKRIGIPASHQQLTHPRRLACAYKLAGQRLS